MKIVSGGQTGVDRGALYAALDCGVPCGGWCPEGREAEDGPITDFLPLRELPGGDYEARTRQNVLDSDCTVVFFNGEVQGGTRLTVGYCNELDKPILLLDAGRLSPAQAEQRLRGFLGAAGAVINVAGPRASDWPDGAEFARRVLREVLPGLP